MSPEVRALTRVGAVYMLSRHDVSGVFLFASTDARKVIGHEASVLVGRSLRDVVTADDAPLIEQVLARAAATEEPVTVICQVQREGAAPRRVEICGHSVRHPERGEVIEIHCVTRDVTTGVEAVQQAEELARRLEVLIDNVPGSVWSTWESDGSGVQRPQFVSNYAETLSGYSREEWYTSTSLWTSVVHPDDRAGMLAHFHGLAQKGQGISQVRWIRRDGRVIWVENHIRVHRDGAGRIVGLSGVTMDITARKEAEEAQARLREEIMAEISTPLIPICDQVVVMPLLGTLDRARVARAVEALLHGVSSSRARVAIVDITGVPTVDAEVADALVRAARGVRLLGARVVLTGIRPEVAQTLVSLGTDLQGIVTLSTLASGIRFALG